MSESKHTPGPWVTEHGSLYDAITSADGDICTWNHLVGRSRPPQKANARLIAAAPELLEVCEMGLALFHVAEIAHAIQGQVGMEPKAQFAAAIAKAKPDG